MKELKNEMTHIAVKGVFEAENDDIFYFGDICYILRENIYDGFWGNQKNYKDGIYDLPVGFFAVHGTAYGDGEYRGSGKLLRFYGVDAGVLGLVSSRLFDPKKYQEAKQHKLGAFFKVKKGQKIEFDFDKGEFEFKVVGTDISEYVDTKYGGDQEEGDEQGDYDDDDDGTADYDEVDESIEVKEEFEIDGVIVEKGDRIKVKEARDGFQWTCFIGSFMKKVQLVRRYLEKENRFGGLAKLKDVGRFDRAEITQMVNLKISDLQNPNVGDFIDSLVKYIEGYKFSVSAFLSDDGDLALTFDPKQLDKEFPL